MAASRHHHMTLSLPPHASFPIGLWALPELFSVAILTQKSHLDGQGSCSYGMMGDRERCLPPFSLALVSY